MRQKLGLVLVGLCILFCLRAVINKEEQQSEMELHLVKQRFIDRLYLHTLPIRCNATITSIQSLLGTTPPAKGKPLLELYHSVRDVYNPMDEKIQSIIRNGFRKSMYGNKGPGVYLSSHSRYAWNWGGPVVFVCHVNPELPSSKLHRYRSEMKSGGFTVQGHNGWEYLVKDPKDVQPAYLITYKVKCEDKEEKSKREAFYNSIGWVPHGQTGCKTCDLVPKRCDCPLTPHIDEADVRIF